MVAEPQDYFYQETLTLMIDCLPKLIQNFHMLAHMFGAENNPFKILTGTMLSSSWPLCKEGIHFSHRLKLISLMQKKEMTCNDQFLSDLMVEDWTNLDFMMAAGA